MITETYRDVEIVLLEEENVWRFTANGRERTAPTLPKARAFIDNALDKVRDAEAKKWQPIECYYLDTYPRDMGSLDKGRITSVADHRYGNQYVWFSGKRRGRAKERIENFCAVSPDNEALFDQLREMDKEREALEKRFRAVAAKVKRVELPKDDSA